MLGNLLRPWLLARLVTSGTGAILAIAVLVMAVQLLRAPVLARSSEGQLLLDRRAELLSTLTKVASIAAIASLVVAVIGADRMHGTLRGAMCAYGVLDATPYGFRSLAVAIAAALGGSAWLALHHAEILLARPTLTHVKLLAATALTPVFLGDLVLSTLHATSLDFREVASCCSSGLSEGRAVLGASGGPRLAIVAAFFTTGLAAAVVAAFNARAPSARLGGASAILGGLALLSAPLAIVTWVAPHAYGTPNHLCPFCLLHGDEALGIGWLLYTALFLAITRSLALGIVSYVRRAAELVPEAKPEVLAPYLARASAGTAIAWMVALLVSLAPWALYALESGGRSLFG